MGGTGSVGGDGKKVKKREPEKIGGSPQGKVTSRLWGKRRPGKEGARLLLQ